MTNEQLAEAIRELQGIAQVQRRDLDRLQCRVEQLETQLDPYWAEKAEVEDLRRMDEEFVGRHRGLISMDAPPPVGNDGSGPPPDYDG